MLSYKHQVSDDPLKYLTISELFEQCVKKFNSKEALVECYENERLTFSELKILVDNFAAGLISLGLEKGDRIGIWTHNHTKWIVAFLAAAKAGLISVFINVHYQHYEIDGCLKTTGLKALITDIIPEHKNNYDILENIIPDLHLYNSGRIKCPKYPELAILILISSYDISGTHNFMKVLNLSNAISTNKLYKRQKFISIDDPVCIQFTSGTTGCPKATVTTHHALINCSFYITRRLGLNEKDHRICLQVPLFHSFGTIMGVFTMLHCGSTIIIPSPRYSPRASLNAVSTERCSLICGTPTMYLDLINLQKVHKSNIYLEIAVTAGANISRNLLPQMKQTLHIREIKNLYGSTETVGVFCSINNEMENLTTTTVGCLLENIEIKIINDQGLIVPLGTPGELCVRGYSNLVGYWNNNSIQPATSLDGWFKTGDLFILHENGYGQVVGRTKDVIIRGGENVYPEEVEELLNSHKSILQCQVLGFPSERLGEEVCAVVRLKHNHSLTTQEVHRFCAGKLAWFKIPKHLYLIREFPVSSTGKILKKKLRCMLYDNKMDALAS